MVEEIAKADRAIKDTEIRMLTIKASLDAVDKEIDLLVIVEAQLDENVRYLKKKHVIALAIEYKKSKLELANVKNRLTLLRNDREKVLRAYDAAKVGLGKIKVIYEKLLKGNENNVLQGNFGRKDG